MGLGHYWPNKHNLKKLGKGLLGDATYPISRFEVLWFQTRKMCHVFPYISLCKTCDPEDGAMFGPSGIL